MAWSRRMVNRAFLLCLFTFCLISSAWSENSCDRSEVALQTASQLRGLKILSPVTCVALDKVRFRALLSTLIKKDIDAEHLEEHGIILSSLGLIPEKYDFKNCIVDALAVNAAAFYTPHLKIIAVPDWIRIPTVILVHESVHALQDQHFDTKKLASKKFLFDDENSAQGALLEGDAMSIEELFLKRDTSGERADPDAAGQLPLETPTCRLPETLIMLFDALYQDGTMYVNGLRSAGGLGAVDKAFRNPPLTTREIRTPPFLHPLPPQKAKNSLLSGSIGQLGLRSLLTQTMQFFAADRLSLELLSDSFEFAGKPSSYRFKANFSFQTDGAARAFYSALTTLFQSKALRTEQNRTSIRIFFEHSVREISLQNSIVILTSHPI